MPLQAIFTYKSLEGMKCIRVINKRQPITFNREEASRGSKPSVLARAGRRQAANYAEQGRYDDARRVAFEWGKAVSEAPIKSEDDINQVKKLKADLEEIKHEIFEQEGIERKAQLKMSNYVLDEKNQKLQEIRAKRDMMIEHLIQLEMIENKKEEDIMMYENFKHLLGEAEGELQMLEREIYLEKERYDNARKELRADKFVSKLSKMKKKK